MRTLKFTSLILIIFPLAMAGQEPDSTSALFGMREAELNFSRESAANGRKAAFINNLAERSVIFTDRWITNGLQFLKEVKAGPSVLKWEPEYMDIALSGDFGISTGPWEVQEYRPNTAPLATGYYLTVWEKDVKGTWKAILDAGSTTPPVSGTPHLFSFPDGADRKAEPYYGDKSSAAVAEISDRENGFLARWKEHPVPLTYMTFLSPGARMQLDGHLPATSVDTIMTWIADSGKLSAWRTTGSGAARSGDLGYTYGYFESAGAQPEITGHYVRIWKRQPDKSWLIILEMRNFE